MIETTTGLAVLRVESGGRHFDEAGRLKIRFEAHIFARELGNPERFGRHFYFLTGSGKHNDQFYRRDPGHDWQRIHSGREDDQWAALGLARGLHDSAALRSTSMGSGQVMGFNHDRIGYPTVQAMFRVFADPRLGVAAGLLGFVNYCLSDPALVRALRDGDYATITRLYNGVGLEQFYMPRLEAAHALVAAVMAGGEV